jgi:hypothetical protein
VSRRISAISFFVAACGLFGSRAEFGHQVALRYCVKQLNKRADRGEQTMSNDFLPAIVSVGILVSVFLFAWISDVRRIQRLNAPELMRTRVLSEIESESVASLSMSTQ